MDAIDPIPRIEATDISARGRIANRSGWHVAERRVNTLALRLDPEGLPPPPQPAFPILLKALGGSLALANRSVAELAPTVAAVNRIIDALNALPRDANYADLERALGLRPPRETHDRIGDAMARVLRTLAQRRNDAHRLRGA
ncbi:MAG: hypothetical protein KatS3mg127_1676 [Silanimonas sp.]|nr:MAG: hypothetical protein KatS3mg127_1676 [Silanimonas sp.]